MTDDSLRETLTFEQAEGAAPLPSQLSLGHLSPELRARLWAVAHESLQADCGNHMGYAFVGGKWAIILRDHAVQRWHQMVDEVETDPREIIPALSAIFKSGSYTEVLGFLQFVLRHPAKPPKLAENVARVLIACRAAYRLVGTRTIVPIASEQEGKAIIQAMEAASSHGFTGARAHLETAAAKLSEGDYPASIRESIHAVEAVARTLEPTAHTLEPALAKLNRKGLVHGAMRAGFASLYGFTSDEQGIRHALLDAPAASVDETDALYMLGSCSSFVTYLIARAGAAQA